jgi:cysteinyl-tRNA synthetase
MHTGFLNVSGEKMSKSLGNFITIREILRDYDPEVFRFFVLSTHYRSPIDFSESALQQSENSLHRIYKLIETIDELLRSNISESNENDIKNTNLLLNAKHDFLNNMDNDFNTPNALSVIFNLIRDVNRGIDNKNISKNSLIYVKNLLIEFGEILGFEFSIKPSVDDKTNDLIKVMVEVREKLRERKDWELSDLIRSRLGEIDIILEDK